MVSMLDRKLLRDVWNARGQVMAIALVVAAGIVGYCGSLSTYDSLRCPPLGRSTTLKLDFAASQHARVVVDLSQDPPRTFLDGVREAR